MASGFSQDSIADFLRQRGGTVTSPELLERFKAAFPQEPHSRAAVRSIFKSCVDSVAFVKTDSGVKHVCLRRQFRYCPPSPSPDDQVSRDDAAASAQVQQKSARDSGYGNDWRRVPHIITEGLQEGKGRETCHSTNHSDSGFADKEDERCNLSGSEDSCSPKGSRKHFIQVMMNSSPEVRNSIELRSPVCLTPRSDGDSASLGSASLDVDRTSITLDPAEHEWMMCASDAEWDSLHALLSNEPNLVLKKDFVTGFTCLHWAAKHGKQELIALIINFAKHHNLPISVDVRSNMGYTPLHIAAIHSHMEVLKLLVGAYNADVEIRDYSGRKACHYLTNNVSVDIRDIIGAYELTESKGAEPRIGGRWRFSKVLQNNLKPIHQLSLRDSDLTGGEDHLRSKPVRRRSSLSRMKPNLQKIRQRASQLVHSTSFRDKRELDESEEKPSRSRPKTHFLD
uniref:SOWAHA-C winged helix-turn-helix domain-containing protein n=1 Tax=Poecilia mexicana TaxID=48701 RepID=A0A3B3YFP5_9TELE